MNVTELRIGNFVDVSFKEDGLRFLREIDLVHLSFINAIQVPNYDGEIETFDNLDLIYGIPLTEEWLLKFGFEKKNYKDIYKKYNGDEVILSDITTYEMDGYICLQKISEDLFSVKYNGFGNNPTFNHIIILSVHSFQNLHFALTGKELTYNK